MFWTGPRKSFRDFSQNALGLVQIGGKSQSSPADVGGTCFSEGFALPAKRGKTISQLAPSEPEEKDGDVGAGFNWI